MRSTMKKQSLLLASTAVLFTLFACGKAASTDAAPSDTKAMADKATSMVKEAVSGEVENYKLDIKGAHAFIQFKVKHLGYSWLHGRFNDFDGEFTYDTANPNNSTINVSIDTTSVDSNHAERDKHLRNDDFLQVEKFPQASFKSTSVNLVNGKGTVTGDFTFLGMTKPLTLQVQEVGHGDDPWGGYRRGFTGTTSFVMKDFGVKKGLGPNSAEVFIELDIEGIRQ